MKLINFCLRLNPVLYTVSCISLSHPVKFMYTVNGINVFNKSSEVQMVKVMSLIVLNKTAKECMKQYDMTHNYVRYHSGR